MAITLVSNEKHYVVLSHSCIMIAHTIKGDTKKVESLMLEWHVLNWLFNSRNMSASNLISRVYLVDIYPSVPLSLSLEQTFSIYNDKFGGY